MTGKTPTSPDELRAEIEQTRADLGDTAAALAAKTDVKSRMKDSAARAAGRAKARVGLVSTQVADRAGQLRERAAGGRTTRGSSDPARRWAQVTDAARRPVPVAVASAAVTAMVVAAFLARRSRR